MISETLPALRHKRVLFADDLDFVQRGTAIILVEAGLVVQVCASGAALRQALAAHPHGYDAVIVDLLNMGADFVPEQHVPDLAQAYAHLPFVIFSNEDVGAAHYLDQGVRGYVSKVDGAGGLLAVLDAVLRGEHPRCSESVDMTERLSRREREVLRRVADGLQRKQVALELGISEHTVDVYCKRIIAKLDAYNITNAVAIAYRARLLR